MTAEFPLAVHALVYLYKSGKVTNSNELAENICTNPARVRKVMTLLKNAGLISSGRGKDSGYSLPGNDGDITLEPVSYTHLVCWLSGRICTFNHCKCSFLC